MSRLSIASLDDLQTAHGMLLVALSGLPDVGASSDPNSEKAHKAIRETVRTLGLGNADLAGLAQIDLQSAQFLIDRNTTMGWSPASMRKPLAQLANAIWSEITRRESDSALLRLIERRESGIAYLRLVSASISAFETAYIASTGKNDVGIARHLREHIDRLVEALLAREAEIVALRSIIAELRAVIASSKPTAAPNGTSLRSQIASGFANNLGVILSSSAATIAMALVFAVPNVEALVRDLVGEQEAETVEICMFELAAEALSA